MDNERAEHLHELSRLLCAIERVELEAGIAEITNAQGALARAYRLAANEFRRALRLETKGTTLK